MSQAITARACIATLNERSASAFLILLLCGDIAFIAIHVANAVAKISGSGNEMFGIDTDGGYPEIYQYLKFFWLAFLLTRLATERREKSYLAWALLFTYLLLDDSLEIHESVGSLVAANLNFAPPFGLRLQDLGELAVSAISGIILLPLLVLAYKNGSAIFRRFSEDMAILFAILLVFGVGGDMLHSAIKLGREVGFILGTLEDGGEMLAVSLILWYVFLTEVRSGNGGYLGDLVRTALARRGS